MLSSKTIESIIQWEVESGQREPIKTTYEVMRAANEIGKANCMDLPFAEQDIRYAEFMEKFVMSQKEKDIVYVSHFFHKAYSTIFITIMLMRKEPTKNEREEIQKVASALRRLGNIELLTKDVPPEIVQEYIA
jgi:hypothetical protein